jgi:predicted Zn-dependent protease with MMP-like domain/Flp pilus assembly protein TadD
MSLRSVLSLAAAMALGVACQKAPKVESAVQALTPPPPADVNRAAKLAPVSVDPHPKVGARKVEPLPVCEAGGIDALAAARRYYDEGKFERALSCAAQAAAEHSDEPQAHSERAAAFTALARLEEAQLAYARALALDAEHLDALLGAAHLFAVTLPSSRERDELGVLYAERGLSLAQDQGDKKLMSEFALIAAMAYNDLGQPAEALARADKVHKLDSRSKEALYERAVALFELCRFGEAKNAFNSMVGDRERAPHAYQYLGLLMEREGKDKEAAKMFAKARALLPGEFPEPQQLTPEAFKSEVNGALASLPDDMKKDLNGIPVQTADLPDEVDLLSGENPLSPAILGLYRGPPLGEACAPEDGTPCRSVVLYRKNLARAVRSREELVEQIRITLLHEVGHLRGEDDHELAARGLE